jgi:hypothetical protein
MIQALRAFNQRLRTAAAPVLPGLSRATRRTLHQLKETAQRVAQDKVAEPNIEVDACGRFGWRRCVAACVDALPVVVLAVLWLDARFAASVLPPEEVLASWVVGAQDQSSGGLWVALVAWLGWSWLGIARWQATPGMKAVGLAWAPAPAWKRFLRPVVYLVSLLPLGLGGTYAFVDGNSRGCADLLLRLRWRRS